jgi:site-specific DNA-adenine methylase
MSEVIKAPFPYFGGKSKVASVVWKAFGNVDHYVEPFAGSLAVLLARPTDPRTETVNDADMYLANFWRALRENPEAVAEFADWPVNEIDLTARHLWLVNEGHESLDHMWADPDYYDAKVAGWWVWGLSNWIGSGWCTGDGPWHANDDNYLVNVNNPERRHHLGNAGQGINRRLPHLGDAGKGIENGVSKRRSCLIDRGIDIKRPHLTSEKGINRQLVSLGAERGVLRPGVREDLLAYFLDLAERLRNVRVCCGDWSRVVTDGALSYGGTVGIFLDPPYTAEAGRDSTIYRMEDLNIGHAVAAWAIANGDNPRYRIALCGYEGEYEMPSDWYVHSWKAGSSYQSSNADGANQENRKKERIYFSPHCLKIVRHKQLDMFAEANPA